MLLPLVIGHRGAAAVAPENTLESIRQAWLQGVSWVEFDVQLTRDDQVVVFHDDDLHRTSNGRGAIRNTDWGRIQLLDAGSWFSKEWQGIRVPNLQQTFALLLDLGLNANVEIKIPDAYMEDRVYIEKTVSKTISIIDQYWTKNSPLLISSFSTSALRVLMEKAPRLPRGLLLWGQPDGWLLQARSLQCLTINIADQFASAEWVKAIRQAGYEAAVYTINNVKRARELIELGVNGLFSDCPAMVLAGLRARNLSGETPTGIK